MERLLDRTPPAPYPGTLQRLSSRSLRVFLPRPSRSPCLRPFCSQISFTIVSLTFVFNFIGFLSAACANVWLSDHLGFGKTITLGAVFQIVAYCLQCWAPPFPLFCFSFVLNGIGQS